jgi:SpoVK/Ycf46/Vps4 family AAA+-type ATPase
MKLARLFGRSKRDIDREIAKRVAPAALAVYRTAFKQLPAFRFVDLFNAIEATVSERRGVNRIESENDEDLNSLLHGKRYAWNSRRITQATRLAWPTSPDKEVLLPADHFWVAPHESGEHKIIIRLKYQPIVAKTSLEVASVDVGAGEALMEAIETASVRDSVYRNQTLEISFQTGTKDEYGDVEKPEQLKVSFKRIDTVSDQDLVVEEDVRQILLRNVVDLHERRDLLKAFGVPVRRGVLLYGPPGTGKTYACRYLCGKLPNTTRIMVGGSALLQVNHVFQLARLLQPAVLFLEDVDLVFMSREVNLYSSVLGELLDHMDGLRPFEDIGFVLTTNAIDRMEAAVRDRPGRISQCIHFSAPSPKLRSRYLAHYLQRYDCRQLEFDKLVRDSEGATQAFLKDWVHRAVQVASGRVAHPSDELILRTADFEESLREMHAFSKGSTGRIIGFHGSD